jgi:hypothetical protein
MKLLEVKKIKHYAVGFVVRRPEKLRWGFAAYDRNFDINV